MNSSISLTNPNSKDSLKQIHNDVFNNTNVAIWIIDASELRHKLDKVLVDNKYSILPITNNVPGYVSELKSLIKITDVNDYTLKLYESDCKKLLCKSSSAFFGNLNNESLAEMLESLHRGNLEYSFNTQKETCNGTIINTTVDIKIPQDYSDCWSEWIITETKASEDSLGVQHYIDELNKIKEQQQIQQKIISIISHDLQSPFNNVIGFSDIMLDRFDDYPPQKIKMFLRHINDTAQQSYNLLNNLLNWAKLSRNGYELKKRTFSASNNIEEVMSFFKTELTSKSIKIFNLTPPVMSLYTDIDSFHFVMRNLISNAIKFSDKNSRIAITAEQDKDYTTIIVKDEGIGMDDSTREKILNSEELYSCVGTNKEKGNGLGLKLCLEFLKRSGAKVDIVSAPRKGTSFKISFPNE